MMTYGDGRKAPPAGLSRESIELQRVGSRIAYRVRSRLIERFSINSEADISPTLMRLVFHYRARNVGSLREPIKTAEINLIPGHPIDDPVWVDSLIDTIVRLVRDGESDLIVPWPLDYYRLRDEAGQTVFEEGKCMTWSHKGSSQKS